MQLLDAMEQQILRSSRNPDKNSIFYFLRMLKELSDSIAYSKGCFPLKSLIFSTVTLFYVNICVKAIHAYMYTGIDLYTYPTVLIGK